MNKSKDTREFLKEDGYLEVESCSDINKIIFHPNLNVMLIFMNSSIIIFDINSGAILQKISNLSSKSVNGKYLTDHDKILFWNNNNLGLRSIYPTGVLLLDTILQAPLNSTDNIVRIEILLSEALLLHNSLVALEQQGVENSADVTNELVQKIGEAQKRAKKGIKAQKWETICLELPHSSLKVVASTMVMELKSLQRHIPALSIASAINERLTDLIVGGRCIENDQIQRFHMYSEAARRKTFDSWPHMDYKWALPDQMAQAGFYHQSSENGDDRAMCFTCSVCLVCWEKTDEPWSEHERHSPDCIFLKGEYTQNVPLSVTYATSPAVEISGFDIMSSGDSNGSDFVCMGSSVSGDICVWNVERQLEKSTTFNIKTCEKNIIKRFEVEIDLKLNLNALCMFKKQTVSKIKDSGFDKPTKASNLSGTRIIAGVKCDINNVKTDDKKQAFEMNKECSQKLLLVLYAVTEGFKTTAASSKTSLNSNTTTLSATVNGNVSEDAMNTYSSVPKNGSSLITILESSYEERLDGFEDILKFMDSKDHAKTYDGSSQLTGSSQKSSWSFMSPNKTETSEMDSLKSITMNGPSTTSTVPIQTQNSATKTENEVICFPIQTIELEGVTEDSEIKEIFTSCDNRYVIVVCQSRQQRFNEKNDECVDYMEIDEARSVEIANIHVLVYEIDEKGLLLENIVSERKFFGNDIPIEFCILPKFDTNGRFFIDSLNESSTQAFVITCVDGSIKVLSITTLKTLSEARIKDEKFISSVYCKNLERLCACTNSGKLHFYSFYDLDSSDELEDEVMINEINEYKNDMPSTSTNNVENEKYSKNELIANRKDLNLNDLKTLYSLTLFDEMLTPYSAEVPGCWTELVQAKRRYPQNIGPGDDVHLIRTWRLHNDATTFDEHLIELSLPKSTSIGHIDFKFTILQPCSNPPAIQVTLLKQKSIGLCCRRKQNSNIKQQQNESEADVDDNIDFNLNSSSGSNTHTNNFYNVIENPVLSEEYLQARNAEILAGPIELSTCFDLNEQGGTVTFVSSKLLKSKARNYLIHLKTMTDVSKDGHTKTRGCDWLHEISISIRATREVPNISNERLQRLAMLESNTLLNNLIKILVDKNSNSLMQNLSMDIIYWILNVNLSRYRIPKSLSSADANATQNFCVNIVQQHLSELIQNCIISNNRSMAKKTVKLIITTMHGAQNLVDQKQCHAFQNSLKDSILAAIADIKNISHAGALRWLIILISGTSNAESQAEISTEIIRLLIDVLSEISTRSNPLNSVLQSRFGLYGMPFESELFDMELPSFVKGGSNSNSLYSNVFLPKSNGTNGSQQQQQQQQNQFSDLKNFCSFDNTEIRVPIHMRRKSINNHIKGLLEVEPLHFTCCSTSEATRIENMDSLSMQTSNVIDDILVETPSQISAGTSKLTSNNEHILKMPNEDIKIVFKNSENEMDKKMMESTYTIAKNVVDKIFYSQIKKNKFKEPSYVKATAANMPIFTGDEEFMILQQGEKDQQFEVENNRSQYNASTVYSNKVREFIEETNRDDSVTNILPWHKLLSSPSKQMIVVDRMHSGARRQVTLDFGYPILLTDLIIPACSDLASLTIDVWCFEEEGDCVRLAISQDIAIKALILSDLQPPPVCRYLRLSVVGRYGMSATRCKLPMGSFYGHVVILDDSYADPVMKFVKKKKNYIKAQLKVLNALYEDTHCRYCLSSSKLSELLQPLLRNDNSNMSHMQTYLNRLKETDDNSQEYVKISSVYEECMTFQNQLNVVKNVIKRLEKALNENPQQASETSLQQLPSDKLRVISECLVESLLHFITTYGTLSIATLHNFFDLNICNLMFKTLVINGDSHIRIATCSMLVKMCSYTLKPWWGTFFSDIFTTLFSSQNIEIFPQDRVFILLTYLGKKSIQSATCRTIVIDSILKTVATLLAPLSNNYESRLGIWRNTDLTLLSWLLLFLSVCLDDNNEKKDNLNPRWDFMSGDIVKARLSISNSSSRSFSRSFKKRFIQNKQSSSNQNIAEKVYMMQEQLANVPSMMSNTTGNLDSVINKAQDLKNHLKKFLPSGANDNDYIFCKNLLKKSSASMDSGLKASNSSHGITISSTTAGIKINDSNEGNNESAFDRGLKLIKPQNILVVIRGLIGLLLNMDFTCNMDLFLLTCKIIAKLVNACKIPIQLSSIITVEQLLQLVRIAVWENQQNSWAVHAITCLLQDILEADRSYKSSMATYMDCEAMDIDQNNGNDLTFVQALGLISDFPSTSTSTSTAGQSTSSSLFKDICNYDVFKTDSTSSKYQLLPSLIEDDTDGIEDILDDILEQSKKLSTGFSKKETLTSLPPRGVTLLYRSKVSSTMDARLESGLDINTEIFLRRLILKSSIDLIASLPQQQEESADMASKAITEIPAWSDNIISAWNTADYQKKVDTNMMLMEVFENIFTDLHLEDSWLNLEQVLQLWLTLNGDSNEVPKVIFNNLQAKIPFGEKAVYGLLKALATRPALKIRGWCLGFLCLIYSISSKPYNLGETETIDISSSGSNTENCSRKIGQLIIQNENFEKMLLRFCNGIYKNNSIQSDGFVGPTVCRLLQELFTCLQVKCQLKDQLRETLLRVCYALVQQDGAISKQLGPIDAQNQLIKELLSYQYQKSDLGIAMSIIECVSGLVYNFVTNAERIQCQKSSDNNSNSNNVFGSLFATVLGSENTQSKAVTDSTILMNLIKLTSIFIRTKLPPLDDVAMTSMEFMQKVESQTDEIKAENQIHGIQMQTVKSASLPTFTDTVLQHFPTMNKFLSALSHCNTSSAALLVICSIYSPIYNESKNTFSDPINVEDALFQLIIYMNKLSSQPILIIKPLFDYIQHVSSIRHTMPKIYLSEPFLWLMLKILETPMALEIFCEMGGIRILAENLVRSNRTLLNMHPNLVTIIMQHLSKAQSFQNLANQVATGSKKSSSNSTKHEEGLINFAPYCTITSENPSAQPADVLIQGQVASHRRARAAAWSYLFYPNETHVDLILTLPTAVLLREIQLQPHLSTLASCPSAVAIEISRDGMSLIPLTQPISTSGMTCIRLKFPQPEIATHLVIRLYRPKDSSTIGLSTISILGKSIFSDENIQKGNYNISQNSSSNNDFSSEEESQSEISFGWLRILAQCFNVATFNPDKNLSNMVISSASEVHGFMEACCSLLSIAPSMSNYLLQNLETVLLKLGLHNRELSLKLIDILLNESIPHIFKLYNETVSDILYQLCTTADSFARDRIQMIIDWLINLEHNGQLSKVNPNSGYIKCLASILWQAYATNLVLDLGNLITQELFDTLYGWLQKIAENSPMKLSIDSMMCSICCIRPEFFNLLLRKTGVLVPPSTESHLSDDMKKKDSASVTDDSKQINNEIGEKWYSIQNLSTLNLSSSQMQTIAMACQSPLAIYQLIDSGLPTLFTNAILEFCRRMSSQELPSKNVSLTDNDKNSYPMITVRKITEILNFLSDICSEEGHMRDWLGTYEGSLFWEPLLTLLCNNKLQSSSLNSDDDINNQCFLKLEETVIKFLSNVTSCHPKNQDTLTTNLISVIRTTEKNNYNINHQNTSGGPSSSSSTLNSTTASSSYNMKYSISGFTRRLVLQLLLESEKIVVSVRSDLPLLRKYDSSMTYISNHPSKKPNSHHLLFYVSINTKCQEIMENSISIYNNLLPSLNTNESNTTRSSVSDFPLDTRSEKKDLWDLGMQMNFGMEFLSVAAGVTAKDKRSKEMKNQENAQRTKEFFNVFKMKPDESKGNVPDSIQLIHTACPDICLTSDTTIAQILTMLKMSEISLSSPCINLNLVQFKNNREENICDSTMKASDFNPLPSPLQIFSSRGGLSLLAHYLPTVYPEQPKATQKMNEKDKNLPGEWVKGEWIKIEPNEEIYEDVDDALDSSSKSKMTNVISSVPQHSLAAFGLFLKLPAYSEVLLRDKVRAQCLLRLILGVTGDGEGNEIYENKALSSSLPTLPFEILRQLLDSSPLSTDDGLILRRMIVEVGAIHLVLNCLSIFTHHSAPGTETIKTSNKIQAANNDEQILSDDKSHVYWAKGTGFGTGSTQQSWNVEQALSKQKSEEEHVVVLLQVLSSYINPGDIIPNAETNNINYHDSMSESCDLPPIFTDLLQQSCLIPALCSYLRNDSVLDITRHIPLYRAILQLLRALSISSQLIHLLLAKQENDSKTSIASLLGNMKSCVDTYASRLKINKKSNLKGQSQKISINLDESDDEGLALLIPDIQETAALVQSATFSDSSFKEEQENVSNIDYPMSSSIEQKYLEVMKKLQFDTYDMIVESENGYRFTISHHFESNVRMSGDRGHPARVKRLAQETVTLSTSLPLSFSSSVFVRCDTDRLDIMKVLITGPAETPYANGCFEFDVYFPHDYPNSPMLINLETTGRHSVRFNPNLYNDGKVCLSVLNTWHGRPEEKWNAQTSSFLQVLVSIQSLILVSEPYFNEPGFERSRGTPSGNHSSREYNSNIYQACVKWAMLEQIRNPSPCFKDVIYTHFWLKRNEICAQIENWIAELSRPQVSERSGRTISFNSMVLRRQYRQLKEELAKLPVPEDLKNFDCPFNANLSPNNINNSTSASTSSAMSTNNTTSTLPYLTAASSSSITTTESIENSKEAALMEIFNSIEEQHKKEELEMFINNEEEDHEKVNDELLNFSDSSLDLLDKATKTMKDIEKMLTDD
ncbi:hypothetical protein PVAND_000606 [Polypedilum vanderplanki]|uniref:Dual E2 ubiquitin-conjugating enzyme/E3 ubiquitin-protein ligase BIRC6 n=1 Tax=Polypedilum vanderplanki TaxID=319348 RepID=A0A9J6BLG7_POLVA|nr:hypothetical protein PVAND_000606 [Polypedilum vanderplanki]